MEGEESGKAIQPTCVEVETTTDENGENVEVYYLDVPDSEDAQVLDISNITNILSQEGIQIVETDGTLTEVGTTDIQSGKAFHQNVILELEADGTICQDQSAAQSAEALLNLSKSHSGQSQQAAGSSIKMMDILDVSNQTPNVGNIVETETQIAEPVTATYVLDENGTMVPLSEYRDSNLLEVEVPAAQAVEALGCWCGKEFYSQETFDKHQLTHQKKRLRGSAVLKCELCSQVFHSSSKLATHHRVAHPDGMPWECLVCFRRFSKKLGLKVHLRAHSGLKQHKCSYCDRSFSYKNALLRHIRLHTKDKPYKCTICGEAFQHMWSMRRHRAIHKPKHLYQCDICSKTFKQKTTLFIHARIHTGHRPYSCEICRKAFTLKSSLNQHLRIHTGERPKVCPICEKAFRQTSTLRSHMNLHNHEKPHKCRYCRQRFTTQEEAKNHEAVHVSNKSWQCDECGMRFKNQSLLARHVRKHTNERPFQCKVCGKSFCQSGSLQSHMRTHTKEKPYQCRLCPKTYTTSGTLLLHIRKAHNLEAKSVKEVFPSTQYVEDQKIFTIPTPLRHTTFNSSISGGEDGNDSVMSEVLSKEGLVFEEVVEGDQEDTGLTTEDGSIIIQRINPLSKDNSSRQQNSNGESVDEMSVGENVEELDDDVKGEITDATKKPGLNKSLNVKDLMRRRNIKSGSLTLMNDSGQYKVIDTEKENSLYAQARQEAALGLAELSLVGGVVVSEKKPGTAYRTVARGGSDLDSAVDPSVTKIILSKEGGVMNSQDPHQCPDCKRIFGRKSIMVEHRRIHTDEKPYKCDYCPSEFRQSAQLACHIMNKHTKEKLYHCTFCQKKFLSRGITIRHINFHHKLKLRVCESMCPGWKIDDAIFVEKREPGVVKDGKISVRGGNSRNLKFGKKSDITILNSLAGLGSPTVKVKFGTDKKKLATKIPGPASEPTIEYCATDDHPQSPTSGVMSEDGQQTDGSQLTVIKTEQPDSREVEDESQEAVIGTWYVCETCAMQFNTMDSLRWHLRQVHNTTLAESDVCYVFEDEPAGTVTKENTTSQIAVTPASGGEELQTDAAVGENVVVESNTKSIMSDNTDDERNENIILVSSNADDLDKNKETIRIIRNNDDSVLLDEKQGTATINIKSTLKCTLCSLYFGTRIELEQHLMSHNDEEVAMAGLHRCDTCGIVMKNTQQITKHILKVHGVENIYGCSICDKEFFQESSVLRHIKFFHKWEMKIRGEGNIPVLLKPASDHLKIPGASDKDKVKGRVKEAVEETSLDKKSPKNDVKVTSRFENDMTFISLEVGDLDHLQLYREDGQEVRFEVVSSNEKATVIRIKDPQKAGLSIAKSVEIEDAETSALEDNSPLKETETVEEKIKVENESLTDEKVTTEVIPTKEASNGDKILADASLSEDPKVTLAESPAKIVISQSMNRIQHSEETDRMPKVLVVQEKGVIPAIREKGEGVIHDTFNTQNEVQVFTVSEVEAAKPPDEVENEKNEVLENQLGASLPTKSKDEPTETKPTNNPNPNTNIVNSPAKDVQAVTESMDSESDVIVAESLKTSPAKNVSLTNSKASEPEVIIVEKSNMKTSQVKNITVTNSKDSEPEVVVVEKNINIKVSPTKHTTTTPNSKVRKISVLNKRPLDIVTDKKQSPVKEAVVSIEKLNARYSLWDVDVERKNTESMTNIHDIEIVQSPKRGRPSRGSAVTPSSSLKKSEPSKPYVKASNTTPKSQTVSRLTEDCMTKTPKATEQTQPPQPVSQSRSGRVIKRKRFADE